MTKTASINGVELCIGQFIYIVNQYGKHLRKVNWLGNNLFEWHIGFAEIEQLELNTDKKSKVKFILKQN